MSNIYNNLITALITPFENNQIDFVSIEKLINYQIENQVKSLIVGSILLKDALLISKKNTF